MWFKFRTYYFAFIACNFITYYSFHMDKPYIVFWSVLSLEVFFFWAKDASIAPFLVFSMPPIFSTIWIWYLDPFYIPNYEWSNSVLHCQYFNECFKCKFSIWFNLGYVSPTYWREHLHQAIWYILLGANGNSDMQKLLV